MGQEWAFRLAGDGKNRQKKLLCVFLSRPIHYFANVSSENDRTGRSTVLCSELYQRSLYVPTKTGRMVEKSDF